MSVPLVMRIDPHSSSGLPGAWRCTGKNNEEMVDKFAHTGIISNKDVEDAFRAVPRGAFVPPELQDEAYVDAPIRGDPHVHLSAPHMYATVLEALQLTPGLSFLNIGSGTGYFSCLAGYILKPRGTNHGIEIHEDLVEFAIDRVNEFLRFSPHIAQDVCRPNFLAGNCFRLDPSCCNYDRIYCGAACHPSKVSLILALTKIGGFAVVPCRNKLLKIQRVSGTGVKQTCISEVCFAALVPLSPSDESLPKLNFPPKEAQKREKLLQFLPPDGVLVSRSPARTSLARIRALQEASKCLHNGEPLPVPFCYVPSQRQLQELRCRKTKHSKVQHSPSPVDKTIHFFGPKANEPFSPSDGEPPKAAPQGSMDLVSSPEKPYIWDHLHGDKLWETVLEYYYSLCNVSLRSKLMCSQLYLRQKVRKKKRKKAPKSCPSYAELAQRLGIPLKPSVQQLSTEKDESKESANNMASNSGRDVKTENMKHDSTRDSASDGVLNTALEKAPDRSSECARQTCTSAQMPSPSSDSKHEASVKSHGGESEEESQNGKRYKTVLIQLEQAHMDQLRQPFTIPWGLEDDQLLVRFLCDSSNKLNRSRCKGWFKAEQVRPELFSKSDILAYPRLASCTPEKLSYRAVVLCRVARVLDSILHLLAGPSLLKDHDRLDAGHENLDSFTEASFVSSHSTWDVPSEGGSSAKDEPCQSSERRLEKVRCKKQLSLKKVRLTQTLQDKYRDQQKLLKKQLCLVEEQNLLVQNMRGAAGEPEPPSLIQSRLQEITSMKVQRQELLSKQQKLQRLQAEQEQAKTDLMSEVKKLQEEEEQLSQADLTRSALPVQTGLTSLSITGLTGSERKENSKAEIPSFSGETVACTGYSQRERLGTKTTFSESFSPSLCHYPSGLLPQLRFLLPLCRQRSRITQELLRSSELPEPDQMPLITVNRRAPLRERRGDRTKSVVLQVHRELKREKLHFRWNKWKYDQWWEVKFIDEGIIDQGGGFRDSLAELADELCPPESDGPEILPYFIKTPNHRDHTGDYQDCYIPNPSCQDYDMYRWIGKLMGAMYRSDESLTLAFPPFVWKLLVGEHVTWAQDYAAIDAAAVKIVDYLETLDEETYQTTYSDHCTFSAVLSDGRAVELIAGGEKRSVTAAERPQYATLVRKRRAMEFTKQLLAIKGGLTSVIPETVLGLMTWNELETAVCGDPNISVAVLKLNCKYGDELNEASSSVKQLWTTLTEFSCEERSRFLRFVTGRKRPPAPFVVVKSSADVDTLPSASTCASTLFVPSYSSQALVTEKLRYAIFNCVAIDTDTSPW